MGCNSGPPLNEARNLRSKLACEIFVWVSEQQDFLVAGWIRQGAGSIYGVGESEAAGSFQEKFDIVTRELCARFTTLPDEVLYDGRNAMARKAADWWEAHQKADREREAKEAAALADPRPLHHNDTSMVCRSCGLVFIAIICPLCAMLKGAP